MAPRAVDRPGRKREARHERANAHVGAPLGHIRCRLGLTQTALARTLGVAAGYLNQMERNNCPLSRDVVQGPAGRFGVDVALFSMDEGDRLMADLREALADPLVRDTPWSPADLQIPATNAPGLARALPAAYRAHARGQERLASLDTAVDRPGTGPIALPWEAVRDFCHCCDNCLEALDRSAERFALEASFDGPDKPSVADWWLSAHRGIETRVEDTSLRRFDPMSRVLSLGDRTSAATRSLQIAVQVVLPAHGALLDATLDLAPLRTDEARAIARIGLANQPAGGGVAPWPVSGRRTRPAPRSRGAGPAVRARARARMRGAPRRGGGLHGRS